MKHWLALIPVVIVPLLAAASVYTVREGEAVLITQAGEVVGEPVTQPGFHFRVPLLRRAVVLELGPHSESWQGELITRDAQRVPVSLVASWRVADPMLFHRSLGDRARAESLLMPALRGELRDRLGRVSRAELEAARPELLARVLEAGRKRVAGAGMELIEVRFEPAAPGGA